MSHTFYASPTVGAMIYENSDNAPLNDPYNYRSRVLFYSGFRYPSRALTFTGSVTFALGDYGGVPERVSIRSHTLAAHGLGVEPLLIEGRWIGIGTGGADVPMVGSVPIQGQAQARWVTLGADATNIYVHEMHNNTSFGSAGLPPLTVSYEVHVLEFPTSGATDIVEITPTLFRARDFSSAKRYVRATTSGGYALASGVTCNFQQSAPTGTGSERIQWHYTVPGFYDKAWTTTTAGTTSDPGAPTPTVQSVTV